MCATLGFQECVCNDRDDYIPLNELTREIEYAVANGFLPLFIEVNDRLEVRKNITPDDVRTATTYYNFAFTYVDKKRKRNEYKEIKYIKNNVQCVLQRILNALYKKSIETRALD